MLSQNKINVVNVFFFCINKIKIKVFFYLTKFNVVNIDTGKKGCDTNTPKYFCLKVNFIYKTSFVVSQLPLFFYQDIYSYKFFAVISDN
jgi:hypothetical protein